MNGFSSADMSTAAASGFRDGFAAQPAAEQEAVAYWRVTFRMYRDDPELCVLFVGGQDQPTLDSLGVTPRPLELVSVEPRFVKQHRWDQYGERCLDCGDKDWMNDPVCRQRLTDPCVEATPSIAVDPSTEITSMYAAAPVAAAPIEMSPEFTDTARAALAWVLWHHQGGSSPVGQPLRFALGMGDHERLPDWRIAEAKRYAEWAGATTAKFHEARAAAAAAPGIDLEPFRDCVTTTRAIALQKMSNALNRGAESAAADAKRDIDACDRLLALIDASPKGGNTDENNDLLPELRDVEDYFTSVDPNPIHLATVRQAISVIADSPKGGSFPWDKFPAYLIDKCEGDMISEEGLQQAVADMSKDPRYYMQATSAEVKS